MNRLLSLEEFGAELFNYEHTAFRLEQQRTYLVDEESELFKRWQARDLTPPTDEPAVADWLERIAANVAAGKRVQRVRVQDEPLTDYQQWQRWFDAWNRYAGEDIRYMRRARALEVGLLPAAGDEDWWLFDSSRLIVMRFDDRGLMVEAELTDDPARVVRAGLWRDLATHHSIPGRSRGRAA